MWPLHLCRTADDSSSPGIQVQHLPSSSSNQLLPFKESAMTLFFTRIPYAVTLPDGELVDEHY
jgi:hypothetical protein